mmetsp:Transcript_57378/g.140031  ORF Transcript_57378/g.140031 Transcript_57378/m.140031 type:complete len:81 (+) Transcript_57378:3712-3954(+)
MQKQPRRRLLKKNEPWLVLVSNQSDLIQLLVWIMESDTKQPAEGKRLSTTMLAIAVSERTPLGQGLDSVFCLDPDDGSKQ